VHVHMVQVNGGLGIVATSGDRPITALILDVDGGLVRTIHLVANPEKLDGVCRGEAH
jgi:RNA polymerase sigma-70 factor, ECF subfamily